MTPQAIATPRDPQLQEILDLYDTRVESVEMTYRLADREVSYKVNLRSAPQAASDQAVASD